MSNEHVHPAFQSALEAVQRSREPVDASSVAYMAHASAHEATYADPSQISAAQKRIRELESANANLRAHIRHLNSIIDDIAPTDYAMVLEGDIEETPIPQEVMIPAMAELMLDIDVRLKLEKIVERKYMQYVRRLNDDADWGEE
jgi:hypothetical protein